MQTCQCIYAYFYKYFSAIGICCYAFAYLDRVQQTAALLCLHLADIALHFLHLYVALSLSSDEEI